MSWLANNQSCSLSETIFNFFAVESADTFSCWNIELSPKTGSPSSTTSFGSTMSAGCPHCCVTLNGRSARLPLLSSAKTIKVQVRVRYSSGLGSAMTLIVAPLTEVFSHSGWPVTLSLRSGSISVAFTCLVPPSAGKSSDCGSNSIMRSAVWSTGTSICISRVSSVV